MDLYKDSLTLAQGHPSARAWSGLSDGLERAKGRQPTSWQLPAIGCEAYGKSRADAMPAIAAMVCSQISMLLVDDILDQDPRGEYRQIGEGPAANLATGFVALAIGLLLDDENNVAHKEAASAMSRMIATVAHGQELDVKNQRDEQHYWEVTRLKSALFFGTGLYLGALYAGADPEKAEQLLEFGEFYGTIMQIHDDLNDTLDTPAGPDWLGGRYPLPILFAEAVDHPQRARFLELRPQVEDPAALEEAQAILVSCGAISYSINELMLRHEKANAQLARMQPPNSEPLERLLDEVISPVRRLFDRVGAPMASYSA